MALMSWAHSQYWAGTGGPPPPPPASVVAMYPTWQVIVLRPLPLVWLLIHAW